MTLYGILSMIKTLFYKVFYFQDSGKNFLMDWNSKIWIKVDATIRIGKNVHLRSRQKGYHAGMSFPCTLFADKESYIEINDNCRLNGCYIHAQKKIVIGKNCVFAAGCQIMDANGHLVKSQNRTKGRDIPQEIIIGENVWIATNAVILKGSIIGDNSVIGASSVVQGVFPENSLIKGNPAVLIDVIKFDE